jgi:HEAT repeat protein
MMTGTTGNGGRSMRWVPIFVVVLSAASTPAARADETDDVLAKRMSSLVRDFRQPLASRVEAARVLAKLGPRAAAAVPDLVAVLSRLRGTEQEPLQEAIVEALGQIGSAAKTALPALAKATARTIDIDLAIKASTEQILNASDAQNIDVLTFQLLSRDPSLRLRAAKALGDLGPAARAAVPALVAALADTDGDARRGAIAALRLIQPGAPPPEALVRAIALDLRDPDANFRLLAARALGRIGPPAVIALPDLEARRADPDPDVRRAVGEAYARIVTTPP